MDLSGSQVVDVVESPSLDVVESPSLDISGSVIPPPLPTLTLAEVLSAREVLLQRELEDAASLEAIGHLSIETLRPKLISWAVAGCPNNFVIHTVGIAAPTCCSDGVVRSLADYIEFCSGKPLVDHLVGLQATLPDIQVAFTPSFSGISIVVLKV
jgi:hypothetical protein